MSTESNVSEDTTTSAVQPGSTVPSYLVPYRATLIVILVLGILASGVVILGLWLAGRSKLNASSAYIANHTILELVASVAALVKYSIDMSGILKQYNYPGAAGWLVCVLIDGGTLIVLAAYGGRACVIIHTLDRY